MHTKRAENHPVRWIVLAIAFSACGGVDPAAAPPCEAVGARFVVLAKSDLETAKVDADTRRLVLNQIPAMRDNLVNACRESKWEPSVRTCLVGSLDHAAFEQCESALTAAQRATLIIPFVVNPRLQRWRSTFSTRRSPTTMRARVSKSSAPT
jgi:hypothetical protein